MQYLGGKTRIAKQIAAEIDRVRRPGQLVWDAFCGGLSVSVALRKSGPVLSTDACAPLIALYQAVQAGWDPPAEVSRSTWEKAKDLPDSDPLKAFCAFGCSFGGIWFSSFAENYRERVVQNGPEKGKKKRQWTHGGSRARLLRDVKGLIIRQGSFFDSAPRPLDVVLYLDPPYKDTQGYETGPFDHERFYSAASAWARHVPVFISEYASPIGQCVWEKQIKTGQFAAGRRTERLFYLSPLDRAGAACNT